MCADVDMLVTGTLTGRDRMLWPDARLSRPIRVGMIQRLLDRVMVR